jgi:hypothetical protein
MAKSAEVKVKFLEVKRVGTKLAFVLSNGSRVEFDTAKADDSIREHAMYHGFNQKIRDSMSGAIKEKDFAAAVDRMKVTVDSLYAGDWNRQGGGGIAGVVMEDLANAISQFKNTTFEKAFKAVSNATAEKRAEWAKNAKITALMAEYKAKRLAKAAESATDELDIPLDDEEEDDETPEE